MRKRWNRGQIGNFLDPWDLEIERMTLKNNRAPFLCPSKLCLFHRHLWIETRVIIRKLWNQGQNGGYFGPCNLEIGRMTSIQHNTFNTAHKTPSAQEVETLKLQLSTYNSFFTGEIQEDACECLLLLIEIMDKWFGPLVEQITVTIVQIMIQATDLAQILYGGHF